MRSRSQQQLQHQQQYQGSAHSIFASNSHLILMQNSSSAATPAISSLTTSTSEHNNLNNSSIHDFGFPQPPVLVGAHKRKESMNKQMDTSMQVSSPQPQKSKHSLTVEEQNKPRENKYGILDSPGLNAAAAASPQIEKGIGTSTQQKRIVSEMLQDWLVNESSTFKLSDIMSTSSTTAVLGSGIGASNTQGNSSTLHTASSSTTTAVIDSSMLASSVKRIVHKKIDRSLERPDDQQEQQQQQQYQLSQHNSSESLIKSNSSYNNPPKKSLVGYQGTPSIFSSLSSAADLNKLQQQQNQQYLPNQLQQLQQQKQPQILFKSSILPQQESKSLKLPLISASGNTSKHDDSLDLNSSMQQQQQPNTPNSRVSVSKWFNTPPPQQTHQSPQQQVFSSPSIAAIASIRAKQNNSHQSSHLDLTNGSADSAGPSTPEISSISTISKSMRGVGSKGGVKESTASRASEFLAALGSPNRLVSKKQPPSQIGDINSAPEIVNKEEIEPSKKNSESMKYSRFKTKYAKPQQDQEMSPGDVILNGSEKKVTNYYGSEIDSISSMNTLQAPGSIIFDEQKFDSSRKSESGSFNLQESATFQSQTSSSGPTMTSFSENPIQIIQSEPILTSQETVNEINQPTKSGGHRRVVKSLKNRVQTKSELLLSPDWMADSNKTKSHYLNTSKIEEMFQKYPQTATLNMSSNVGVIGKLTSAAGVSISSASTTTVNSNSNLNQKDEGERHQFQRSNDVVVAKGILKSRSQEPRAYSEQNIVVSQQQLLRKEQLKSTKQILDYQLEKKVSISGQASQSLLRVNNHQLVNPQSHRSSEISNQLQQKLTSFSIPNADLENQSKRKFVNFRETLQVIDLVKGTQSVERIKKVKPSI